MKKIFLSIVLIGILFISTACGKKDSIVGKWTYETGNYTYTFNEDGTGDYNGLKFTYTIEGNKISFIHEGNTSPVETTFSIKEDKLNIIDALGNDTIYIRK